MWGQKPEISVSPSTQTGRMGTQDPDRDAAESTHVAHAELDVDTDDDEEGDEEWDGDAERWWAFSTPQTIRALSKWISTTATHLDEEAASASSSSGSTTNSPGSAPLHALSTTKASPPQDAVDGTAANKTSSSKYATSIRPLCKGLDEFTDFLDVRCGEP